MPNSPVFKYVSNLKFRTERSENIIIRDEETAHYYSIYFEDGSPIERTQAYLMCCNIDDNTNIEDNWYNVEELSFRHRCVIAMFRDFIGIDFTKEYEMKNKMKNEESYKASFKYLYTTIEYLLKFGCDNCGKKTDKGYSDMGGGWCNKCYDVYLNENDMGENSTTSHNPNPE